MYTMPDKKQDRNDYVSWKGEWAKVLFDYARFAVLHIIYIRELNSQKPFFNFTKREQYIRDIAEELISYKLRNIQEHINKILKRWNETEVSIFLEKAKSGTYSEAENDAIDLK